MPDKNTKEFTIKVNGLEQSIKYSKLLLDNFEKIETTISNINIELIKTDNLLEGITKNFESIAGAQVAKVEELVTKTGKFTDKLLKAYRKDILDNLVPEDALKKKIESVAADIPKTLKPHIDQVQKDLKDSLDESEERSRGFFKRIGYFVSDAIRDFKLGKDKITKTGKEALNLIKGLKIKKEEKKSDATDDKATTATKNSAASKDTKNSTASKDTATSTDKPDQKEEAKPKEERKFGSKREKEISDWQEHWGEIAETVDKYSKAVGQASSAMFDLYSKQLASKKEEAEKYLKDVSEKYDKVVEARKKSDEKIADLHNKSVNLSGGRSLVMQAQMDEEMAKREQLVAEEKRLEAEKVKAKAKIEKQEARQKRASAQKQFVQGTIDLTSGILKAWSLGPIIGPIMAAVVAAAGGFQLAKMAKEIKKMADGGLLRGRRHSEGGMRIEGTNIEVEGGEYVINRRTTDHNMGLIRYINSQRRPLGEADMVSYFRSPRAVQTPPWRRQMEEGGALPVPQLAETMSRDNALLLNAIQNIRIDSRVAVTDIIRAQERMTEVDSWVGM